LLDEIELGCEYDPIIDDLDRKTIMRLLSGIISCVLWSTVPFLVACSNSGQSLTNKPNNSSPVTTSLRNTETQGTGDGGGGNTCMGRPLESYSFDVMNSPAYRKHIAPIEENIKRTLGGGTYIVRMLNFGVRKKKWFVLPCTLKKLPPEKIGSAVQTEQAAIQTFSEVWLNEQIFNAMPEKDQAELVMHEMMMAVRLIKFESLRAQCEFPDGAADRCRHHDFARDTVRRGKASDLTESDYANVRQATIDVFKLDPGASLEDWENFFAERDFHYEYRRFSSKADQETVSGEEFLKDLERATLTGFSPRHGRWFGAPNGTLDTMAAG